MNLDFFFTAFTFFAYVCCHHIGFYAMRKQNVLMLWFPLCSNVHIWFCNTNLVWGSVVSVVHRQVRLPVQITQLPSHSSHRIPSTQTAKTSPPHRSPEIVQLIKPPCLSTSPRTFFAFQERREEFPWTLQSTPRDLARSRRTAAMPASLLPSS